MAGGEHGEPRLGQTSVHRKALGKVLIEVPGEGHRRPVGHHRLHGDHGRDLATDQGLGHPSQGIGLVVARPLAGVEHGE
jgi:hypothetical protein